jgi:hypothetical protein
VPVSVPVEAHSGSVFKRRDLIPSGIGIILFDLIKDLLDDGKLNGTSTEAE